MTDDEDEPLDDEEEPQGDEESIPDDAREAREFIRDMDAISGEFSLVDGTVRDLVIRIAAEEEVASPDGVADPDRVAMRVVMNLTPLQLKSIVVDWIRLDAAR